MTQSRTTGTTHGVEVIYHVYFGPLLGKKNHKSFHDEGAADKFFKTKQAANLHVEAYKEVIKTTTTIEKLS